MTKILDTLNKIKRPKLLMQAARFGVPEYKRKLHLPLVLGPIHPSDCTNILAKLMRVEQDWNEKRRDNCASYSFVDHVDVLIAILAEAHHLRASET